MGVGRKCGWEGNVDEGRKSENVGAVWMKEEKKQGEYWCVDVGEVSG